MNLFYGRESVDKDRFLFDRIAEGLSSIGEEGAPKRIVLLVPDQYTLQAERNAFLYLGVRGFLDLEILSQSRLAERILSETGGSNRVHIDKHGRHMLLSKILSDVEKDLTVFLGMGRSHSFLDMTNDFISEMKQYNTGLPELRSIVDSLEEDTILRRKLSDIALIFEQYEEQIEGRYIDTEDLVELFLSKIGQSTFIQDTQFFMAGFDSLTPKTIRILTELDRYGKGVDLILTSDASSQDRELFLMTMGLMTKLEQATGGQKTDRKEILGPFLERSEPLHHLERELFAFPFETYKGDPLGLPEGIRFCRAANYYAEAETAAQYISTLVREKGLRYRDIAVICNDVEGRGSVIKRVFDEFGISFFMDQKRTILHDPAIVFVSSLLSVITEGWLYEDVFQLLKTDLCPIQREDYESLENYAIRYKIRGNRWKKEFLYGGTQLMEGELDRLNQVRQELSDFIGALEMPFVKAKTVREKTAALSDFLRERADLPGQIEGIAKQLEEEGQFETALEMNQIWEGLIKLFEQLVELIGEETISDADYKDMLQAGFESVEVGLIPSTIDQVVVGTMQRTRVGKIKALVVIGANDGILPATPSGDDLLSQDEKVLLLDRGIVICQDDDRRMMEERLAIYKNLSKPERYLWIGYSASDPEGKELRPSMIFDRLRQLFPQIPLEKDLENTGDPLVLIERPRSSLKHLSEALRSAGFGEEELSPAWRAAYNWYQERGYRGLAMIRDGFTFTNKLEKLEKGLIKDLFQKKNRDQLTLSPSRLEKFGRCPFAHLVLYGLVPEERRIFEVAGREAGDVYHECLMRLAESLTVKGLDITDESSPWMALSKEDCYLRVDSILNDIASEYREGMLISGEEEQYHMDRIKEVCYFAAFAMVEHVQQGRIEEVYFEEAFGEGEDKLFPPIHVKAGDQDVLIEGKIDRVDVLPGGFVKIQDYKSGKEHFDATEAKAGYRLQLMLYLKAAIAGLQQQGKSAKPAGIFYFEIADPQIDASNLMEAELSAKIEKELRRAFRLDGVVLDEPEVIDAIAGEFAGYSEILPIYKSKDGKVTGNSETYLLSEEDFTTLRSTVDQTINDLCTSLATGIIDVRPKKTKNETACKYCEYKSICNFELSFDGCSYDVVK